MPDYNKITSGFKLGAAEPTTAGVEDVLYVFNESDFLIAYDSANPMIVIGISPIVTGTGKLYKFEGTNNSFNATSKMAKTAVGPRYTEEIDFNIAGNSTAIKQQIQAMGYGRVKAIVVNNYKTGDAGVELYGALNGLVVTEAERNAADEAMEGAYKIKLANPEKLREPHPPRSVFIGPIGGGTTTYDSTIAGLESFV